MPVCQPRAACLDCIELEVDGLSVAAMSMHVGGWAGSAHMLAGPFLEPSWPWCLHIPQSLALIPHPWCGLECPHPLGTVLQQAADLRRLITLLPAGCGLEVEPPTETSPSVRTLGTCLSVCERHQDGTSLTFWVV